MIRIFPVRSRIRLLSPITYSRDDFIDILRGLAISFVLIFHGLSTAFGIDQLKWSSGLFPNFDVPRSFILLLPATFGWTGVAIFFAISGFCIHNSYMRERNLGVRRYLFKRTFRIYPPYVLSLFLFAYLWPTPPNDLGDVASHALLIIFQIPILSV
jgi:peptidoglycan/LPS O-acetylase OafA/YrhL